MKERERYRQTHTAPGVNHTQKRNTRVSPHLLRRHLHMRTHQANMKCAVDQGTGYCCWCTIVRRSSKEERCIAVGTPILCNYTRERSRLKATEIVSFKRVLAHLVFFFRFISALMSRSTTHFSRPRACNATYTVTSSSQCK